MNPAIDNPAEKKILPSFRRDLKIYRGPDEKDGHPTFNVYDPVRARYFKFGWKEYLILRHFRQGFTTESLKDEINKYSTIQFTEDEINDFFSQAFRLNLLSIPKSSEVVLNEAKLGKLSPWKWLLYNYLYIRIPLINPDNFLGESLPYVKFLASSGALFLYSILSLIGLVILMLQFEAFIHTFGFFFNEEGFITYILVIIAVKIVHEFSHAYTAKGYGIHVPTMGVALIVLFPVLYTDVTDSWKLRKRSQRLAISIAGVASEITLAGICTLGWAFSSPGLLQSVFFVVCSITWIQSLFLNLNPVMRFDGYYILCDIWGIDNLRSRSFNLTRWKLRKWLLGMDLPSPEEDLSRRRELGMIFYGIFSWVYLFILYASIAIFVYYQFTKILGIFLFLVEVAVFILWPFASEAKQLYILRRYLTVNIRSMITLSIGILLLLWFILPLPHSQQFPAITIPDEEQAIYIPQDSMINKINASRGKKVERGEILALLESQKNEKQLQSSMIEKQILQKQIYLLGINDKDRGVIAQKQAELSASEEKIKALQASIENLKIRALINGIIIEWDENLMPGQSVHRDQVIGKIADTTRIDVVCFVPENQMTGINVGQKANFQLQNPYKSYSGTVKKIASSKAIYLEYPALASTHEGMLPVGNPPSNQPGGPYPLLESYFPVHISIDEPGILKFGETGMVKMQTRWHSYAMDYFYWIIRIVWRESGF